MKSELEQLLEHVINQNVDITREDGAIVVESLDRVGAMSRFYIHDGDLWREFCDDPAALVDEMQTFVPPSWCLSRDEIERKIAEWKQLSPRNEAR